MIEYKGKYTTAKVFVNEIEKSCSSQIIQFINHPAFTNPVRIMPDTHAGTGSVIGFTMEVSSKIIPNTIGVDIGCRILSVNVGKNLFSNITKENLEKKIKQYIPFGTSVHKNSVYDLKKYLPWEKAFITTQNLTKKYNERFGTNVQPILFDFQQFERKCKEINMDIQRAINSIGTLGGGNHFIEIGKSRNTGDYWISIHSGSRQFGEKICRYWQNIAKENLKIKRGEDYQNKIQDIISNTKDKKNIPKKIEELKKKLGFDGTLSSGLETLEGNDACNYLLDMVFAQHYASKNVNQMFDIILDILSDSIQVQDIIETTHNYIDFNDLIIRKGAIKSIEGFRMVIPFNMRDGILICEGRSNPDWNFSAPHGAGRVLARRKAKEKLSLEKFKKQMEGIYTTSVCKNTLDEAPDAYKDPKIIEEAIKPTAKIIDKIIPVINIKSTKG